MTRNNILVTTYWPFDSPLIATYTLPYLRIMRRFVSAESRIYLVTLTPREHDRAALLRMKDALRAEGITLLNFNYAPFGFRMLANLASVLVYLVGFVLAKRVDTIHAWCTPGGAIGYLLSAITRRRLVLDSFEPHAESMVETGTWKPNGWAFRILFALEKLQLKRASAVICAAPGMMDYAQQRYGIRKDPHYVKPACTDLRLFHLRNDTAHAEHIRCVYAGKFGDIYLTTEVFRFFRAAHQHWGERFSVLLLTSHARTEIERLCQEADLSPDLVRSLLVPHSEVADYMSTADFAICPVRPVPTKRYCSPVKNGEYWALGLPVVITQDISDDSRLIDTHRAGYALRSLDDAEYHRAVLRIDELLKDPTHRQRIRALAETHRNFSIAEKIYAAIYA